MAVFTRTNGNAQNVVSVGNISLSTEATSSGLPISTGIGKPIQCFGITANASLAAQLGTGEAVETILRTIALDSTIVMYQVDTNQLSVLVEAAGNTTTNIGARITAQGNLSTALGTGNVWANAATVTSTTGFKIA